MKSVKLKLTYKVNQVLKQGEVNLIPEAVNIRTEYKLGVKTETITLTKQAETEFKYLTTRTFELDEALRKHYGIELPIKVEILSVEKLPNETERFERLPAWATEVFSM